MLAGPMAKDAVLSQAELHEILDRMSDGVLVAAVDGKLVAYNAAAKSVYGLLVDEAGSLTPPLAMLVRGEQIKETALFFKTGERPGGFWLSASSFPLKDRNGQVQSSVIVVRDVTESKHVVEALKDGHARFRALFDSLFEFAGLLDSGGLVLEANKVALDYAGVSMDEISGKPLWETPWWPEEERTKVRDAVIHASRNEFIRLDVIHTDRAGVRATFDVSLSPVLDEAGKVQFLIAEGRNVESLRGQEAAMREALMAQSQFGDLLNAAPDAILEVSGDGTILLANDAAAKTFEYAKSDLIGLNVDELVPEASIERHRSHRSAYSSHPSTRAMGAGLELQARRKSGELFPVEISLSPRQLEAGFRVVAIVRDITDRRLAEEKLRSLQEQFTRELAGKNQQLEQRNTEVERSNRLKTEFLASMSHELRSPLHTIIGFAELLAEELEGPLNEKQKRFVGNIHQDSQHLLEIINDLLDISKIEAGRMEYHTEPFAIDDAVDEVLSTIRPQADAKSLSFDSRLGEGIVVEADRLRFKQILVNLLTNAVKFTPERGRITISALAHGGCVMVTVADTGIGIAREHHESIFENFYQVGSTTKGVREGTGLGLAITRNLVEQQGGSIWVESEPGKGSAFSFLSRGRAPVDSAKGTPFVVVVEPEPTSAELFSSYLTPEGFTTTFTLTVQRGLRLSEALIPDALIIDLTRPSPEDWRLIREFRRNPATSRIPVLMVSVSEDSIAPQDLGAVHSLTKPVSKRRLLETLDSCMRHKGSARSVMVVDDEPLARELVQEFLRDGGFDVLAASDGTEALAILGRTTPGAIILDLLMPEMSGFELLSRLRCDSRWGTIPVIVLTGMVLDEGQAARLKQAAVAILPKGQSWKKPLLTALRRALGK
jgi:PAS domain S-box-containing protein